MDITSVRVAGIVYNVKEIENLMSEDKETKLDGHIKYDTTEILIDKNLSEQAKKITLWHEVIHAILAQAEVKHKERITEVLGYGIFGFIQDNPELINAY